MTGTQRRGALLFSDIVGSTEKWARYGNRMSSALVLHDEIAETVFAFHQACLLI